MPEQSIKVIPKALLSAADAVAVAAQKAATPEPGAVFAATPGSPADGVLAAFAAGIATQTAQLSAEAAGEGPEIVAKTSAGMAQLQGQDADNAAQIQAVWSADSPLSTLPAGKAWRSLVRRSTI